MYERLLVFMVAFASVFIASHFGIEPLHARLMAQLHAELAQAGISS